MTGRIRIWLNSMQAHMIGFAFGVIAVLTAINVFFVVIAGPPQRSPMTIYDVSRIVRALPAARESLASEFIYTETTRTHIPVSEAERRLSRILAQDLRLPEKNVRVYLGNRSEPYLGYIERQAALYMADGRGSPIIDGTIVAAVRRADGTWDIYARRSKTGLRNYWTLLRASPWLGFLMLVPLSMWFSAMLARPVRLFARAAEQVGGGEQFAVPVAGPTEIRVAAKALNEMQARIRTFMQERTALVGAIAHDLRTPLNSLRFRIARMPDDVRGPAESDIRQLDRLINSILEYVEGDRRLLSVESIDFASLLQSMVDDLRDQGRAVDLDVVPVTIEGDLLLLRRLFANLLENALNFGSRVSIVVDATSTHAIITVADDGPGMSPAELQHAFEPFFRGEPSRNRKTGGIGLGLAIARSVVDAHGGQIAIENAEDGGLQVTIILPLRSIAPHALKT